MKRISLLQPLSLTKKIVEKPQTVPGSVRHMIFFFFVV